MRTWLNFSFSITLLERLDAVFGPAPTQGTRAEVAHPNVLIREPFDQRAERLAARPSCPAREPQPHERSVFRL